MYAQYGTVTQVGIKSFPQETLRPLAWALNSPDAELLVKEIEYFWDDPNDWIDVGGGARVLTYARVLRAGEERIKGVLARIDKSLQRKRYALVRYDEVMAALQKAAQEENSYY